MARFIFTRAIIGQPDNGCYTKYPRGTTIADSTANAQAGDYVWASLCASPNANNMAPLDSAAHALLPSVPITTPATLAATLNGAGVGEDVSA